MSEFVASIVGMIYAFLSLFAAPAPATPVVVDNQIPARVVEQAVKPLPVDATPNPYREGSDSLAKTSVNVSGMSKYTDTDLGFSFWYPSDWTVTNMFETGQGMYTETTDDAGNISQGRMYVKGPGVEIIIDKVHSDERKYNVNPGACGYCGPLTYYFDPELHLWMKAYTGGMKGAPDATPAQIAAAKAGRPADVSNNTMGGLHMFSTEQRESAVIVPLSARDFLVVTDVTYTRQCGTHCASPDIKGGAEYLARTIVAIDPAVATPEGTDAQIAIIQAEKQAYVNQ